VVGAATTAAARHRCELDVAAVCSHDRPALTGAGVVVGIIDTGFDPAHPDLLDADGKTRVSWVIDFPIRDGAAPRARGGIRLTSRLACAILPAATWTSWSGGFSRSSARPIWSWHDVSLLAAGDGSANDPAMFVGTAPRRRWSSPASPDPTVAMIYDADILTATRFAFERAEALGMPAVVNRACSDFGAHDGSSPPSVVWRPLSAAISGARDVVRNSAGSIRAGDGYPSRSGIHTEVRALALERGPLFLRPRRAWPRTAPSTFDRNATGGRAGGRPGRCRR
jgi:hypothetical protein